MAASEQSGIRFRAATPDDSEFAYRVKEAAFRHYVEQVKVWDEDETRFLMESPAADT
ncbi:hypothetical protein ACFL6X_03825 [Candidatus Latescibacterota bacterium]